MNWVWGMGDEGSRVTTADGEAKDMKSIAVPPPERGRGSTLSEDLRWALEQMIVSGQLQPGARLDEAELAARFSVSRTPVREALKALIAMGLAEMKGRQGVTVATISIPALLEMFEMVAALEGLCAKLAARRATAMEKANLSALHAQLADALHTNDPQRFDEIDEIFHDALYEAAHTHFLAGQSRALRRRVAAYRKHVAHLPSRMTATIAEHARIIEAIERADAEGAFRTASLHVNLLADDMADFIASLPSALIRAG